MTKFDKCTKLFPNNKIVSKIVSTRIDFSTRLLAKPNKNNKTWDFESLFWLCKTVGCIVKIKEFDSKF